jgi:hypothetical protein
MLEKLCYSQFPSQVSSPEGVDLTGTDYIALDPKSREVR